MTITISNIVMFIKGFIIRVMKYIHTQPERQTAYTDPEIGLCIALHNLTMKYTYFMILYLTVVTNKIARFYQPNCAQTLGPLIRPVSLLW